MSEQKRTVAIHVPVLARVEGEGALDLRIEDGDITRAAPAHLRAAALLREISRRPSLQRNSRHGGAHLRHLPGGVSGHRGAGAGKAVRRRTRSVGARHAPGVLLRRMDPESQPAHPPAGGAGFLRLQQRHRAGAHRTGRSAPRPAHPGAGQRTDGPVRRPFGASGGRAHRRFPCRAFAGRTSAPSATSCAPRCRKPKRWSAGRPAFRCRRTTRPSSRSPCGIPPTTPSKPAPSPPATDCCIEADAYDAHFAERHEAHSTALFSTYHQQPYLVGPLARLNLNHDRLPEGIQALLAETGLTLPSRNLFHSLLARAVEILLALQEALAPARRLHDAGFALGTGHAARRCADWLHRSAARPAVASLRNGRRTAVWSTRASCRRPARIRAASRKTCGCRC